jgi:hypothetical protein
MKRILAVLMLSVVGVSCIYAAPKDRDSGIIWAATPIMGVDIADKHTSNYVWRNMSVNSDYETVVYTSTNSVVRQGGYWAVVIASGTIDQVSSGTVSIIGDVDTSVSTGVISIVGNVAVSSAGVYALGDFNFNLNNSSIAVHNLGNSDVTVSTGHITIDGISQVDIVGSSISILGNVNTTVANTVQTYSSWLSSNTATDETATVITGAGVLHGVSINTGGTLSTVTIYDNTTATDKKICTIDTATRGTVIYDAGLTIGLTYVTIGQADITILYK